MSDVNVNKIKAMNDGQLRKRAKQLLYHYRTGKFETVKDNAECPHVLAEYIRRLEIKCQ